MQSFFKIYLPIFFIFYMLAAFVWPTYRTWKQTGVNPITFSKGDTAHDYIGFIMKILIVFLFIAILVYSIGGRFYAYLLPLWYFEFALVRLVGLVLVHVSLIWILIAQTQMNSSWRIGLDNVNKTSLVTEGIFKVSRNPIFLGMILTVVGIFLIIPNALTLCLTIGTYFIVQIQIRLEEAFLASQHGEPYLRYRAQTRRFI